MEKTSDDLRSFLLLRRQKANMFYLFVFGRFVPDFTFFVFLKSNKLFTHI